MDPSELDQLRGWLGKKETRADTVAPWPVSALAATLDRSDPPPQVGDYLPTGWHWLYFLEAVATSQLNVDGHTKRGGFMPPVDLPRRMSAGGHLEFNYPLRIGGKVRRESEIVRIEPKRGKTGDLVFVTVHHTVFAGSDVAVSEEHDIVYRDAVKPGSGSAERQAAGASETAQWRRCVIATPTLLFRYSALSFMAHRIHYDVEYARSEEYPGLVVQGPLQTILLLDLCRRHDTRPVKRFEYKSLRPVFGGERFTVNGNLISDGSTVSLWIANEAGQRAMTATAMLR